MSQELQLGRYEFYPNDRLQQMIEELLFELRRFRRSGIPKPEYTEDELSRMYKELADEEAANPDYFEWVED